MASPVLLFFIGTVSFIYTVFSQVQETEFVSEDNIYYPPLRPFRDILFFFCVSHSLFLLILCLIILIALFYYQTIIVHAKKTKHKLCFVPQSVADRRKVNVTLINKHNKYLLSLTYTSSCIYVCKFYILLTVHLDIFV